MTARTFSISTRPARRHEIEDHGEVVVTINVDPLETETATGTRISMGFPALIVSGWVGQPEAFAEGVANVLTQHFEKAPVSPTVGVEALREAYARIVDQEAFDLIAHYAGINRFDGLTPAEREADVFKGYPDLKVRRDAAYEKADRMLALAARHQHEEVAK